MEWAREAVLARGMAAVWVRVKDPELVPATAAGTVNVPPPLF